MRNGSVIVVVLSPVAIAAAAQFTVSTPPAPPTAAPTDSADAPPFEPPTAPVLYGAKATPSELPSRDTSHASSVSPSASADIAAELAALRFERVRSRAEASARGFNAPFPGLGVDPVDARISQAATRLWRFRDDVAIKFASLSDDEYKAAQAKRLQEFRDDLVPPGMSLDEFLLPPREPEDVDAWVRSEPVDAETIARHDGSLAALGSSAPAPGSIEMSQFLAEVERRVMRDRREDARRYKFEVARLRPESLREFAARRDELPLVATVADLVEFRKATAEWERKQSAWFALNLDDAADRKVIDELVRTIPQRCWRLPSDERLRQLVDEADAAEHTAAGGE